MWLLVWLLLLPPLQCNATAADIVADAATAVATDDVVVTATAGPAGISAISNSQSATAEIAGTTAIAFVTKQFKS